MSFASIRSEGDLEIVLLHETHSLLAEIIGPDLYRIGGTPPDQTAQFRSHPSFNLFLILIVELIAEGPRSAFINENFQNWSLLRGLAWFNEKYVEESSRSGLTAATDNIHAWLDRVIPLRFWCPEVDTEIEFPLSNDQLISFGSNTTKHHLLRLSNLMGKLEALCVQAGYQFFPQQIVAVLHSMTEEVRSRLEYHSTYILELLGDLFLALNRLICMRFAQNPTNHVDHMDFPDGVTSDIFRDLYGDVLVFKRYDEPRIQRYTPVTTRYLRLRY